MYIYMGVLWNEKEDIFENHINDLLDFKCHDMFLKCWMKWSLLKVLKVYIR